MKHLATLLGTGLLFLMAPGAHAALQVSYALNGGAATTCASNPASTGPAVCLLVSAGPVTAFQLSGTSNSPGGPINAQEFGSTLLLQNTSASQATFEVWIAAQGFTFPTAPPDVDFVSNLSLTSTTGTGTAALTSCVDTTNGLAPPTTTFCAAGTSLTNTTLNYSGAGVGSDSVLTKISSLSTPYSISQHITLVLGAGANINVITSATLTPTPEPGSLALFGGILLATGFGIRKRFSRS